VNANSKQAIWQYRLFANISVCLYLKLKRTLNTLRRSFDVSDRVTRVVDAEFNDCHGFAFGSWHAVPAGTLVAVGGSGDSRAEMPGRQFFGAVVETVNDIASNSCDGFRDRVE
jgi:hypothetical protein